MQRGTDMQAPAAGCLRCCCRRRRVFLLGPSHHVFTRKCMLSSAQDYTTPLGTCTADGEHAWPHCVQQPAASRRITACRCWLLARAGKLVIDADVYGQLLATGAFEQMSADVDEARRAKAAGSDRSQAALPCLCSGRARVVSQQARMLPLCLQAEHSLELHTPYIAKIMG